MKMSTILDTLASAKLPPLTGTQLRELVDTAEGKAFADDLKWYAAGDIKRHQQLAAVVHALAPAVRGTVEQLGFKFDVLAIIATAKRDGLEGLDAIRGANADAASRARAIAYLRGAGLHLAHAGTEDAKAPAPAPPTTEPPYYSFKIFGGSAALEISEARTRTGNQHTIQVEGAVLLAGGGRKEFDWRNKIIVQLTVQEAYQTLALLENLIPSVRFDGHGRTHDKSLQIEFQESQYYVRIIQRGRAAVAVPVRAVDAIPIVALLYKQLLRNESHLKIEHIRAMVERMARMMPALR